MSKKYLTLFFGYGLLCALFFLTACSDKSFTSAPGSVFEQCVDVRPEVQCQLTCDEGGFCQRNFDYEVDSEGQITDILFVVDTSGSMSQEQRDLGSKFPDFLKMLSNLNYRIAMTTTDISDSIIPGLDNGPDRNNGNGAYQDGNLLPLEDGFGFLDLWYLDGSQSVAREQLIFNETITREETKICEDSGYSPNSCPSGDERGILAAALTLENNPQDFIRPVGHMAVVFLSDENEGSTGILVDEREIPTEFVSNFRSQYPNKSLTAHSIIVEPNTPRGASCLSTQNGDAGPNGQYGTFYAELSELTQGLVGDICAENFTNQLEAIGDAVATQREVLPCVPVDEQIQISFNPEPNFPVDFAYSADQNEILFSRSLPRGTKIRFQFQCEGA